MAQARDAGAEVLRLPIELPWGGYSGYFADPDGHVWEAVWIPEEFGWVDGSFDATLGASERHSDR